MSTSTQTADFKAAKAAYKKIGASRAGGEAFRYMSALMVAGVHGGKVEAYFDHLTGTDEEIRTKSKALLNDRAKAYDVLLGLM